MEGKSKDINKVHFVSFDFPNGKYTLNKEGKNMMILIKIGGGTALLTSRR